MQRLARVSILQSRRAWRIVLAGVAGAAGFAGAVVLAGRALKLDVPGALVPWLVAGTAFSLAVVLPVALVLPAVRGVSGAEQKRVAAEVGRLKSDFLASMSHELRTPLTAIIGFGELVRDGEAGAVTEKQCEYLDLALASSRHLLQLINDLLDLARIESGQADLLPEPVEPETVLRDTLVSLGRAAESKRIELAAETDAALGEIVIDPRRLRQILWNYLSNALKFTPEGGRVTVRLRTEGAHDFRLEVEDNGIGIAAEELPRLFTNFHQIDGGLARDHQGTGLGLALTKRLVEVQKGRVGIESVPGQGSLFYAVLPRVAEPISHKT